MSTTETPEEILAPEQKSAFTDQLAAAYSMTAEDFLSLKVADRDLAVFLLVRELCSTVNGLEARLNILEDKARVLASPECMQNVLNMFLRGGMGGGNGSSNMGKMLAGMIGR